MASDLSNSEIKSISELHLWLYITHQLTKTKIYIFMVNCGSSLRSSWIKEKVRQKMHLFWLSWLSLAGWESLVVWRKKESLRENRGGDRSQVIMLHRGLVSVWGISVSLDVIHIPIISHYTYNELKSKFAKEKKVFICMHQKDQINFSRYSIPFLQCFRPYKSNIFFEHCSVLTEHMTKFYWRLVP